MFGLGRLRGLGWGGEFYFDLVLSRTWLYPMLYSRRYVRDPLSPRLLGTYSRMEDPQQQASSSSQQVTSRSQTRTLSMRKFEFLASQCGNDRRSGIIPVRHSAATMAPLSPDESTSKPLKPTRKVYILIYVLLLCLYQLRMSFSAEKRVISAEDTNDTPTGAAAGYHKNDTNNSMSACLLIMDDTIKLTEWIAYHYTVLPLSHLIVAIDPASVLTSEIQHILSLWENHLEYIDV